MAYTRAWSDSVLGTNPANTIDTLLANVRQDLNERLTDILGITSFTADPLVLTSLKLNRTPNAKILGGTTNLSLRDSTDNFDNVLVADTGNTTIRGTLTTKNSFIVRDTGDTFNRFLVDDSTGAVVVGPVTNPAGAGSGDILIANARHIRSEKITGNAASLIYLASVGGNDNRIIAGSSGGQYFCVPTIQSSGATLPSGVGNNGPQGMITINNSGVLIYYTDTGRFQLSGTPF